MILPPFSSVASPANSILSVAFAPDLRLLATGDARGQIKLWPLGTSPLNLRASHAHTAGEETVPLEWAAHSQAVWAVVFACRSTDQPVLASASHDGTIKTWDVSALLHEETSSPFRSCPTALMNVPCMGVVALAVSESTLATANRQGEIQLWDLRMAAELSPRTLTVETLRGHRGVLALAFAPEGNQLAIGGKDGIVKLLDLETGELIQEHHLHEGSITALTFSPDSQLLASAGDDMTVRVWDLPTDHVRGTLGDERELVETMVFTPSGAGLLTTAYDWTIRLWDTVTGKQVARLERWHLEPGLSLFDHLGELHSPSSYVQNT